MLCKCGSVMNAIALGVFLCYRCGLLREIKSNEWKEHDLFCRMDKAKPGFREWVVGFFTKQK